MKKPRQVMIFLAALIFAAMPLRGLDLPDLLYEMDIARQSLDRSTLQAIWQQQITAYQAAEKLRNAGLFVMHSTTFSPYLHQLYYRLGQQTHSPEVRWTPQTMQTVIALMRYIALFRTAEAFKSPPGMHVILTGWNQAGILPENDCESFSATQLNTQPVWQATPGSKFKAAVAALPKQVIRHIKIRAEKITGTANAPELFPVLYQVEYAFASAQWQYRLEPLSDKGLCRGMQIYLLEVNIPADQPAGVYHGKITAKVPGQDRPSILQYTLKLQADEGQK